MSEVSNYQIRASVLSADVAAVRQLVHDSGFFNHAECNIAAELVSEYLQKGLSSGYQFFFLETDKQLLAYSCYGAIDGTQSSYDLYWIVVAPDKQGQGLGQQLLQQTEQAILVAGGQRIYIETSSRAQYQPTRQFYKKAGYLQVASLTDFYARGDDKVIYCKSLV